MKVPYVFNWGLTRIKVLKNISNPDKQYPVYISTKDRKILLTNQSNMKLFVGTTLYVLKLKSAGGGLWEVIPEKIA